MAALQRLLLEHPRNGALAHEVRQKLFAAFPARERCNYPRDAIEPRFRPQAMGECVLAARKRDREALAEHVAALQIFLPYLSWRGRLVLRWGAFLMREPAAFSLVHWLRRHKLI